MHFTSTIASFSALTCVIGNAWGQPADTSYKSSFPEGVSCQAPMYPPDARRAEATGTTRLRIAVESDGKISNVSIEHPSGPTYAHGLLDQAAVASIWNCRFPAPQGGKRTLAIQEFNWVAEDATSDRLVPSK